MMALVYRTAVASLAVALGTVSLWAAPETPDESRELTGKVYVLFEQKCQSCHGAQLKEPEGKFGYVLDLARVTANLEMIVKGDPGKSELYRQLKEGDMPPSDSKVAPLTAEEKELVRRWIAAGAPTALPAKLPRSEPAKGAQPAPARPAAGATIREQARQTPVTLDLQDQLAGVIFAHISEVSGVKVAYTAPAKEPRLSIRLKDGNVHQALEYLALCGNFALSWDDHGARIGPNPPREPPEAKPPAKK